MKEAQARGGKIALISQPNGQQKEVKAASRP
jgi:hypothetical protein